MKVLKTFNNQFIYMENNGVFTIIDTKDLSIVRTTFTPETLNVGEDVCWMFGGNKQDMILVNGTPMEAAMAIKYVLSIVLPIKDVLWKQ